MLNDKTGQQLAAEKTAAVARQIKVLDEVLTAALRLEPLSFDRLLAAPSAARFDPGSLSQRQPAPSWDAFAPLRPTGFGRLRHRSRYKRQLAAAHAEYQAAQDEHVRTEDRRRRAFAAAKATHDQEVTQEQARTIGQNAILARRRQAFAAGDAEAVEWFVGHVLSASRCVNEFRVTYHPRTVRVEAELPPGRVVPSAKAFRYVSSRDTVEPVPRPDNEIRQRYKRLVCSIALRVLHDIFTATPPTVVDTIAFSGWVATAEPATGKAVRPCLVTVTANRTAFAELVLASVEPAACLAHLSGVISPDPFSLAEVVSG
jgi:restriction system protein